MINIDKSFIHIIGAEGTERKDFWRANIKSVLFTENKKFFLLKENRSQVVDKRPFFNHPERYEYFSIVEDDRNHMVRTAANSRSVTKNTTFDASKDLYNIKKNIFESNISYLSFEEVNKIISSGKTTNIYCEIDYIFNTIEYKLIFKCEFVIYNTKNSHENFLQVTAGYVPFFSINQLEYGYVSLKVNKENNGCLEFLLNEKTGIFDVSPIQNFAKFYIKKFLNTLLFFYKKNDFTKLISIKENKIKFFKYI